MDTWVPAGLQEGALLNQAVHLILRDKVVVAAVHLVGPRQPCGVRHTAQREDWMQTQSTRRPLGELVAVCSAELVAQMALAAPGWTRQNQQRIRHTPRRRCTAQNLSVNKGEIAADLGATVKALASRRVRCMAWSIEAMMYGAGSHRLMADTCDASQVCKDTRLSLTFSSVDTSSPSRNLSLGKR